jgi:hypothetical protein
LLNVLAAGSTFLRSSNPLDYEKSPIFNVHVEEPNEAGSKLYEERQRVARHRLAKLEKTRLEKQESILSALASQNLQIENLIQRASKSQ